MTEPAKPGGRLAFVDALRGIAAISVVLFHLYEQNLLRYAAEPFPEPFHWLLTHGYLGVYIFFVLSGFVIAHSVRNHTVTLRFIGRFALRRSLRLDPPYWAAIAAAIIIGLAARNLQDARPIPLPSAGDVVAHVFYAQGFFGIPNILGVFWTLCLEIQFYLLYVIVLGVSQRLGDRRWLVFGPLLAISLVIGVGALDVTPALCLWAWPFFFAGVVTSWSCEKNQSVVPWLCVMVASTVVAFDAADRIVTALLTASALLGASRMVRPSGRTALEDLSLGRVMQYLGKISYSLYLVHLLVGSKSARVLLRAAGSTQLGYLEMIAVLLGCLALSVVTAHVFYVVIERGAISLSKRVGLR